jgi:hypothetical protein
MRINVSPAVGGNYKKSIVTMAAPLEHALTQLELDSLPAHDVASLFEHAGEGFEYPSHQDGLATTELLIEVLTCLSAAPKQSANTDGDEAQGSFWSVLSRIGENKQPVYKGLIALLFHLMRLPTSEEGELDERVVVAARCYAAFLQVEGSGAYGVFQPCAFRSLLNVVGKSAPEAAELTVPTKRAAKSSSRARPTACGSRSRTSKRKSAVSYNDDDDSEDGDSDEDMVDEEEKVVKPRKTASMNKHSVVEILGDLKSLLVSYPMRNHEDIVGLAVDNLIAAVCNAIALAPVIQELLMCLLQPIHGSPTLTAQTILRQVLPLLLSEGNTNESKTSKLSANKLKQLQFDFGMSVVDGVLEWEPRVQIEGSESAKAVKRSVTGLLHYMCTQVKDKTEPRARATEAILHIFTRFPPGQQRAFCRFILRCSKNAKVRYTMCGFLLI